MESIFYTNSPEETMAIGRSLGGKLKAGDLIALTGELGSGKTCFVKGVAEGLCVPPESYVRSSSFVIMNTYEGRLPLHHLDLYRLHSVEEIEEAGLEEYLYGDGVAIVEWAEKGATLLKDVDLKIMFYYEGEERRRFEMTGESKRWKFFFEEIQCLS